MSRVVVRSPVEVIAAVVGDGKAAEVEAALGRCLAGNVLICRRAGGASLSWCVVSEDLAAGGGRVPCVYPAGGEGVENEI